MINDIFLRKTSVIVVVKVLTMPEVIVIFFQIGFVNIITGKVQGPVSHVSLRYLIRSSGGLPGTITTS